MAVYVEQISTRADGTSIGKLDKYPDEMTAAIFYHSNLNTNLRLVLSKELKAYYCNYHNESGVVVKQERWQAEPEPVPDPTPDPTDEVTP